MPVLEAHVETPRADRYLTQLTSHLSHGPGGLQVVSAALDELVVDLGTATWTIRSTATQLVLESKRTTRVPSNNRAPGSLTASSNWPAATD